MADSKEIQKPREGMSTLSAQFTRKYVDKVVSAIKDLRTGGMAETKIYEKMRGELKHLDEHTLRRIYDKSLGKPISDDLTEKMIAERKEVKSGTIQVTLKTETPFGIGSILQIDGDDWCVTQRREKTLTLKHIR